MCGWRRRRDAWLKRAIGVLRPAHRFGHCLLLLMIGIGEADLIIVNHRSVGAVEPYYRVVPGPLGCGKGVAFLHRQRFAFDYSGRAMALHHETNGFHNMAMSRSKF